MPYKKFLIVASKQDKAGINITTQLSQFKDKNEEDFKFYLVDEDISITENLDLEKINNYDFIIFASKHESKSKEKTLSVHAPGNWRSANHGGEKNKVCPTSAIFLKQIFEKLDSTTKEHNLDYKVTMEATHHGPLISKPCLFIEIGSTETEYTDRRAGFVIARTIKETIADFKENPYNEIAIAIGGPHYCPGFNKIQLKSNVAISHVIPQYVSPVTEQMISEAIKKTEEEVDFVLLDWKGLGNAERRKEILSILDKLYLSYKKTSQIDKED